MKLQQQQHQRSSGSITVVIVVSMIGVMMPLVQGRIPPGAPPWMVAAGVGFLAPFNRRRDREGGEPESC